MDLKNLIAAIFIVVIVLTLINIEPYHSGYFIVPSAVSLETAVVIIIVSIFIIIVMLIPRKSSIY